MRSKIIREFAQPTPRVDPASDDLVEAFGELDAGKILLRRWGKNAPIRVARVQARLNRVRDSLDEGGQRWLDWFSDEALTASELASVLDTLSGAR